MIIVIVLFLVLMLLGFPVLYALGLPCLVWLAMNDRMPVTILSQNMMAYLNSFTLLSLPGFMLVGRLMNTCGVTDRLFNLCLLYTSQDRRPGGNHPLRHRQRTAQIRECGRDRIPFFRNEGNVYQSAERRCV